MTLFNKAKKWVESHKSVSRSIVIAVCLVVGYFAPHATGKNDGHIEQIAEKVLLAHGIDIDFSSE